MKRRREIKKQQLSPANRALIVETALWEPAPKPSIYDTVLDVMIERRVDQEVDAAIAAGKSPEQFVGDVLFKAAMEDMPLPLVRPKTKEEPITTEVPEAPKRNPADVMPLSAETKQEMVDAYVAGMSVAEICHAYGVGTTRLYGALRAANVPLRGAKGGWSFKEEFKEKHAMPTQPTVTAPTGNGVEPIAVTKLTEWTVTYLVRKTETKTVAAKSFNDAAAAVESDGIEVVSVAKVV